MANIVSISVNARWPNRDVDIYFHVYTITPVNIGVLAANTGTVISPNWW